MTAIEEPGTAQVILRARQGKRFTRTLTVTNDDGSARDISDWTIRMQARANIDDATTVFSLSTASSGITIQDGPAGVFRIDVGAVTTAGWQASDRGHVFDLEIVPDGVEDDATTLFAGRIIIEREVTRG